jgi:hypothetical protein
VVCTEYFAGSIAHFNKSSQYMRPTSGICSTQLDYRSRTCSTQLGSIVHVQ